jgi:methyltransferase OMS1
VLRISKLRQRLVSQAHGDVLEVSTGTGRNLEYYDWDLSGRQGLVKPPMAGTIRKGKVKSLTAVDKSAEMLKIAKEKLAKIQPAISDVNWVVSDATEEIPSPPGTANKKGDGSKGGKYDTVVQTMGLCSVDDPVALLKNLGNCVKEEEGRILLLEHGRGSWNWLNGVLDRFAESHAKEFGCWWNRDLSEIVNKSGLEIMEMRSVWWHGGTTWWIELKKPKEQASGTTQGRAVT